MSLNDSLINSQQNLNGPDYANNHTYAFEDFRLDAEHLMLYRNSQTIALKPKVVETLVALVERRGEVISKEELMTRLWPDSFVEESNLTQNIYLLRKTLGDCADGQPFIENFYRRGYRFNGKMQSSVETRVLLASHMRTRTITDETFESKAMRTPQTLLVLAVGLAVVAGAIIFAVRSTLPNGFSLGAKTSAVAPFQNFKLKRQSDRGDVTTAAISQDAKFIIYTDQNHGLWLKNSATGSSVKVLTESESAGISAVAISPDDNYIYVTRSFKDKKGQILKISLFGGGVQQKITEDLSSSPSLSPDGRELSFIRFNDEVNQNALIIANTDGTGERRLATTKQGTWFGMWSQSSAWSPDGSQIACVGGMLSEGKEITVIRIFRLTDGQETLVIKPDSNWRWIDSIAWLSNNDNLLVISADQSSQGQIYRYTFSSGTWQRVTNDLSNYTQLSVTANGKTAMAIDEENDGNLWLVPADGDFHRAKQITFGRNLLTDVTGVSWTPDGKIVYATNTTGRWEIWIVDADGSNQKQLTQNCAGNDACSQPVVSPDGRYIVFQATAKGAKNIWRMETDGSNLRQLTRDGGFYPSFTPDGRFVVYARSDSFYSLWQIPIEGGQPEQFSKISSALAASVSSNGKLIAFGYYDKNAKQPFQTCVASVGAEAPEKCFDYSRSFPRWSVDSKAFYYLDHDYVGIWKQPLNGKRILFLEFPGERVDNFAFSPDARRLVVARSKPARDIVGLIDER